MYMNLWPWKPGDQGYLCLPLRKNIPEPNADGKHPDWILKSCPDCGAECWESDDAREAMKTGLIGLCTTCAIKKGIHR